MNLLLAFDGSDAAKDAVRDLLHAGLPGDARIRVLSVGHEWGVEPGPQHAALYPAASAYQAAAADRALQSATRLAEEGVDLCLARRPGLDRRARPADRRDP